MSTHNKIVISGAPAGRFLEGIITDTSVPGTIMEIVPATEPVGGKHSWRAATPAADGDQIMIAVLLENWKLGKTKTDAHVASEYCSLYVPCNGDEIQVLLENQSGTADAFAIGDKLIVDQTGLVIATASTPESEPFICAETIAGITADTHCHVFYTGH